MTNQKRKDKHEYAAALSEILSSLSRLRGLVDNAGLPEGDAKQNLSRYLALASIAAHELRLGPDDDLIVLDDE